MSEESKRYLEEVDKPWRDRILKESLADFKRKWAEFQGKKS